MAKALSHIASKLSGSIAGITAQGGPGSGIQLRSKPIPCNRHSSAQSKARSNFSTCMSSFEQLSDSLKHAWIETASHYTAEKSGFSFPLKAPQIYIKWRMLAEQVRAFGLLPDISNTPPKNPITLPLRRIADSKPGIGNIGIRVWFQNSYKSNIICIVKYSIGYSTARTKAPLSFPPDNVQMLYIVAGSNRRFDIYMLNEGLHYFLTAQAFMAVPLSAFSEINHFMFTALKG